MILAPCICSILKLAKATEFNQKIEVDDPRSCVQGQGHQVKNRNVNPLFQVLFNHLAGNARGQWPNGSGSKVRWVKGKAHMGYAQPKGHDIGRWAHINIKLLH